jgi:uncharacterized membrane protein (UPF0127 family)
VFITAKNQSKGTVVAPRVRVASSLLARSIGLLGKSALPADEGLWLTPCTSIHTFFMRFPIDVLFIDGEGTARSKATLKPWRISRWERRAAGALELPAGTLARTQTEPGDKISLAPN